MLQLSKSELLVIHAALACRAAQLERDLASSFNQDMRRVYQEALDENNKLYNVITSMLY